MTGLELVAAERQKHTEKGFTAEHDDQHVRGELVKAAASYALHAGHILVNGNYYENGVPKLWPFEAESWKPESDVDALVKAASFIVAEIDRVQRETKT